MPDLLALPFFTVLRVSAADVGLVVRLVEVCISTKTASVAGLSDMFPSLSLNQQYKILMPVPSTSFSVLPE